jgi:hydrogenase-4 component F
MLLLILIAVPFLGAIVAYTLPTAHIRPLVLPLVAMTHLVATVSLSFFSPSTRFGEWINADALANVMLLTVSTLYFCCSLYAPGYLRIRPDRPNRVFCSCLSIVLGTMSLVVLSQHMGLMWVGMEATSLACAPLLYFNRTARSIEATWKFLLLCSVGIALAMAGTFFLAYAAIVGGPGPTLLLSELLASAPQLSKPWLQIAFAMLLVGYGTKMGLAPMHSWKPDAYGEAPGLIGAILAGGVTTCAFCAILRFNSIMHAAGEGAYAQRSLVVMGLLSMAFASVFVVRQKDYKRMLAYSSIEHMGILALGIGLGGLGIFGALLHVMNNALTKGVLFLSSGNIHRAFGSKSANDVHGALRVLPVSAGLFLAGFLATTGSPPFGPFVSEFTVAQAAFQSGSYVTGALYLLMLFIVFAGMGVTVLSVVHGRPANESATATYRDSVATVAPIVLLMALVLLLGIHIPSPVARLVHDAALQIGATP